MLDMETTYENNDAAVDTSQRVSAQQLSSESGCNPSLAAADATGSSPNADAPKPGSVSKANGKPGAPRGNAHALRTGLRSPKCPPAARGIDAMRYAFRRQAFAAYRAKHGLAASDAVPFAVECRIDSAVRHHKNALLVEWLIRTTEKLPADQFQAMLDKAADFTDRRDKALRDVGLAHGNNAPDDPMADIWAAMLAAERQTPPTAEPATETPAAANSATASPSV
jgi:hypothetical protein